MFDIGITKLAIVGGIALVVIGPEKLPSVAKTIGTLLGRARRYVADVKDEVNRSMDLDELKKMKDSLEGAAREVDQTIQTSAQNFEKDWAQTTAAVSELQPPEAVPNFPHYQAPRKKWRLKRAAVPGWYKSRSGIRTHVSSGAARVARFRPERLS